MSPLQETRYYYHAEGHALSGEFVRPVRVPIEALASTSLPTIGGHAQTRVENFHIPRLVTFKAGHTHVSGSQQDADTFTTSVTSTLECLRILDFLTADRVVVRLTSEHKRKEKEGHMLAIGSNYENLRMGGYPVKITLRHNLLLECKTFEDLQKQVTKDTKSGKIANVSNGRALCSLVEKIETDLPGAVITGHTVSIPHFGEVAFAELFAEPGTKTLTMLRMHLGSPDGATLTGGEARINGTTWP